MPWVSASIYSLDANNILGPTGRNMQGGLLTRLGSTESYSWLGLLRAAPSVATRMPPWHHTKSKGSDAFTCVVLCFYTTFLRIYVNITFWLYRIDSLIRIPDKLLSTVLRSTDHSTILSQSAFVSFWTCRVVTSSSFCFCLLVSSKIEGDLSDQRIFKKSSTNLEWQVICNKEYYLIQFA